MDIDRLIELLLERIRCETNNLDPIDRHAVRLEGEDTIGVETEGGDQYFISVEPA